MRVASAFLVRQQLGEQRGVVKDDAVGDQPTALRPEVLLVFGPESQLSIIGAPTAGGPKTTLNQGGFRYPLRA